MASDIIARGIAAKAAADLKKTAADLEDFKEDTAEALAGKADLVDGKVPSEQLPSYVDDVVEYADVESFPATGEFGKIYVALDTGYTYRWSGSEYIQIGGQDLSVITGNFAEVYDPTSTYEEGDFCVYEDAFYVANQDIDPAEAWDASHWDRTSAAAVFASLQAEIDTKQETLVSGENIKTVNGGVSLLGSGDLLLTTYHPFKTSWNSFVGTTAQFCAMVNQDPEIQVGFAYLGSFNYNNITDLPDSIHNAEVQMLILKGNIAAFVIQLKMTSGDRVPYQWQYTWWPGGSSGWVGFQPKLVSGENIKTVANKSLLGSGNVEINKSDVGLGNVDNTSDSDKPISTATQAALDLKLDAADYIVDDEISDVSENPVQNKVIKSALDEKVDEDDTTNLGIGDEQVEGAPLARSIIIGEDSYNIPAKTSELENDAHFVEEEDTTDLEFNTEIVEGAPLLRSISVGEDDYNLPSKTSDLTNDSGYVDTVDAALSDVSENPVQNKVVKAALDEKVDEGATSGMTISEQQVAGAPLMGSVTIEEDSFNVPTKTSDLQNDSDFLEGEDATELEIRRLFRTEYTITGNITNGTMSGDATIWSAETATVTIAPDEGYELPSEITVTGATGVYDPATGEVALSGATGNVSVTVVCVVPTPPSALAKGDIIHFDALGDGTQKRFRVIDVIEGNTVKLLGLDDLGDSVYNASNRTIAFDNGSSYQNYGGSNLDTYLNTTYYNSLSSAVKSAIVDETLVQSCYSRATGQSASAAFNIKRLDNNTVYAYTRTTQRTVGSRHIHAIELDEIKSYFNTSTGDLIQGTAINELFFEQTIAISKYIWCASAYASNSNRTFIVLGNYGYLNYTNYDLSCVVRPAFKINLSTIEYTKEANA